MNRSRPTPYAWARYLGMALGVVAVCLPTGARGQAATNIDPVSTPVGDHSDRFRPELRKKREIILSGIGAGLLVTGVLVSPASGNVPSQGLDPADIAWSVDRGVVGNLSVDAHTNSDWTRNLALVFPFVVALATSQGDDRWQDYGRRGFVYAEALLMSQGVTVLGKTTLGRARPFAYLPEAERPDHPAYDVSLARTLRSMPSGHSSSAWMGAALAMTDHLLSRPEVGWLERAAVGFLGGALAGATSALRVEGGQHFPSDVLVGAGIGIATGISVPLLHRGEHSIPSSEAWLQMMGGALVGTLFGVVVAQGS